MKTDSQLIKSIMRRVYGVYVVRQLSRPAVRFGALLALALALRELTWVSSVLENISKKTDVVEFVSYGFSAFIGTEFIVQLVVVAGAFIFAYSIKDLFGFRQPQLA